MGFVLCTSVSLRKFLFPGPVKYFLYHKICSLISINCTARQCSPLRRKFMECPIINPGLSLLMKHLDIGQHQKAPNLSAFYWSPHGSLLSIGQYFVATKVIHLPKRTEASLITESDQSGPDHPIGLRGPCIASIAGCRLYLRTRIYRDNFPGDFLSTVIGQHL